MKTWMVEVVITTPEMLVTDDFKELAAIQWEILVVDEAHRKSCAFEVVLAAVESLPACTHTNTNLRLTLPGLKNHNSKLAKNLRDESFDFKHSLLLTGTLKAEIMPTLIILHRCTHELFMIEKAHPFKTTWKR